MAKTMKAVAQMTDVWKLCPNIEKELLSDTKEKSSCLGFCIAEASSIINTHKMGTYMGSCLNGVQCTELARCICKSHRSKHLLSWLIPFWPQGSASTRFSSNGLSQVNQTQGLWSCMCCSAKRMEWQKPGSDTNQITCEILLLGQTQWLLAQWSVVSQ